jgi:hypothetical protein
MRLTYLDHLYQRKPVTSTFRDQLLMLGGDHSAALTGKFGSYLGLSKVYESTSLVGIATLSSGLKIIFKMTIMLISMLT